MLLAANTFLNLGSLIIQTICSQQRHCSQSGNALPFSSPHFSKSLVLGSLHCAVLSLFAPHSFLIMPSSPAPAKPKSSKAKSGTQNQIIKVSQSSPQEHSHFRNVETYADEEENTLKECRLRLPLLLYDFYYDLLTLTWEFRSLGVLGGWKLRSTRWAPMHRS